MSSLHYLAFIVLIILLIIWAAKNDKVSDNESTKGLFAMKKTGHEEDQNEKAS